MRVRQVKVFQAGGGSGGASSKHPSLSTKQEGAANKSNRQSVTYHTLELESVAMNNVASADMLGGGSSADSTSTGGSTVGTGSGSIGAHRSTRTQRVQGGVGGATKMVLRTRDGSTARGMK